MKKILLYSSACLLIGMAGCKKDYLETKPSNGVTAQEIYSRLNTVYSALDGTVKQQYAFAIGASTGHDNFGQKSVDLQIDLMGNDMVVHSQGYGWFNTDYSLTEWTRDVTGRQPDNAWYFYYDLIGQVNRLLPVIDGINDATTAQKETIKGQCLGIRAYSYFTLINLFQQTYKGNETKPGIPIYTVISLEENQGYCAGCVHANHSRPYCG
ncbi:MAG: RagB/SusD family nutrient uptake outer membrane protein [Bacteroidota bacterium]